MEFLPSTPHKRGLLAGVADLLLIGSIRPVSDEGAELRRAYAVELWTSEVPVSLHHAILVIGLINLAFIAADWWTFSEQFKFCLPARLSLTGALLFLWNPRKPGKRLLAGLLLYLATGLMIIWVIVAAGGTASEYSPGLVLLLAGIPILLPVSALQASLVVALLLAIYTAIPLIDPDPISARELVLHLCFPWAAAFGALIACHRLDAVRFADFCKRHALEVASEKLRALDEAKLRFIANVNHELRTPLTLVLLPTEELLSTSGEYLTATQRRSLETIQSNANRLLALVNDVLAVSAATSNQLELRRQPVEVELIVSQTLSDIRPAASKKELKIGATGLESAGTVLGDPDALKRVLLNVLDNAVKCSFPGGRIDVETACTVEGIRISTRDSGVGFRHEDSDRIFERFVQLEGGRTGRQGGLGLGLAIARDLVRLHGGRIWAESDGPGHGAAIHIWLPRRTESDQEQPLGAEPDSRLSRTPPHEAVEIASDGESQGRDPVAFVDRAGESYPTLRPRHEVLVVDDSSEMRALLTRILASEFRVRTAGSGWQAITQIRENAPDLVLADVMMDDLSGTELCQIIKGDRSTRGLPVILLTALADEDHRVNGLELGAEDYVAKPFRPRELIARIRALLQLRSVQRDLVERNRALETTLEALRASKKQSELYSRAVSHDLRGPLAAAGAAVEAALNTTGPSVGRALEIAAENLSRADRMLVALRSFARTVGTPEDAEEIDLRGLLEDVVAGIAMARGCGRVPVVLRLRDVVAEGRAEKLGHVFRNLIDNGLRAVESTTNGEVIVEARYHGSEAIVTVTDNGCGIAGEMHEAIFKPFQRGPCSKPGNLGLGLALARQIVEEHRGRITVESSLGRGSTFTIAIPTRAKAASNG